MNTTIVIETANETTIAIVTVLVLRHDAAIVIGVTATTAMAETIAIAAALTRLSHPFIDPLRGELIAIESAIVTVEAGLRATTTTTTTSGTDLERSLAVAAADATRLLLIRATEIAIEIVVALAVATC